MADSTNYLREVKRKVRNDEMNVDRKKKELGNIIERQNEKINELKLILKETQIKLEEHESYTDLFKRF